jgi:hypothetical protein
METLLTIGVILLIVLITLLISMLFVLFRLIQEARTVLRLLRFEADKIGVEIGEIRQKIRNKASFISIVLGLMSTRGIGKVAKRLLR